MLIAYMIQCHTDLPQVACLLRWLYHPDDTFVVSIDANAASEFGAIDEFLQHSNVVLAPRHCITWGGISIVEATLSSIQVALGRLGWEYFINLSAFDLPLLNRRALNSALRDHAARNVFNFISDFGPIKHSACIWNGVTDGQPLLITAPSKAVMKLHGEVRHLMKPGTPGHANFRPVLDPSLRTSFYVDEGHQGRFLSCRPLFAFEARQRELFINATGYRFGRQWVILHRAICESLFSSAEAASIYHGVKNTFIPDEIFFQTYFGSAAAKILKGGFVTSNQRFRFGAPERITDNNYGEVAGSGAWFARKVIVEASPRLIAYTTELMSE